MPQRNQERTASLTDDSLANSLPRRRVHLSDKSFLVNSRRARRIRPALAHCWTQLPRQALQQGCQARRQTHFLQEVGTHPLAHHEPFSSIFCHALLQTAPCQSCTHLPVSASQLSPWALLPHATFQFFIAVLSRCHGLSRGGCREQPETSLRGGLHRASCRALPWR